MRSKRQTQFEIKSKQELIGRGMTIGELAENIGYARGTVSLCINQGLFPNVREAICSYLKITH